MYGLSVSFTWSGALHTRGPYYISPSEGMRTFLEGLLCARPKPYGLLGCSPSQGICQAQNAAGVLCLRDSGAGMWAALGKRQRPFCVVGKGCQGWGNSRSNEFEAGHVWWQHGSDWKASKSVLGHSAWESRKGSGAGLMGSESCRDGSVVEQEGEGHHPTTEGAA